MFIQWPLNRVMNYLANDMTRPLSEALAYKNWGLPLVSLLANACQSVVGDGAAGQHSKLSQPPVLFLVEHSYHSVQCLGHVMWLVLVDAT